MTNSNQNLSKSFHKVKDALSKKGIDFQILEFSESTRTADEAAKAIGCEVAQIVKSLVFRIQNTNTPILILVSGTNRVNEKSVSQTIDQKLERADAEFVRDVTGYAIGGIPPIGHKQNIETYIDEDLLKLNELWAAAGTPNSVFKLSSKDLVNLTNGKIISVK